MTEKNRVLGQAHYRYLASIAFILTAFLLRSALVHVVGIELPPFITFYPAVVLVALVAGLPASLLSIALSALLASCWILPSRGWTIAGNYQNAASLLIFAGMSTFICVAVQHYRNNKCESQLHSILESLTEGLVTADFGGHIRHWNQAALELHGFDADADAEHSLNEAANIFELSAPDGTVLSLDEWPISRLLRGEQLSEVECKVRRLDRDGWNRVFSYSGSRIYDAGGRSSLAVLTIRDITARKQVEEELIWKTAFLEAQAESTSDAILVVDANGVKIFQNKTLAKVWSFPENIFVAGSKPPAEYVANQTKNPEAFLSRVRFLYDHPNEVAREELEMKDGRIYDRYSGPVLGKHGEHYGRIWTFRDITDRKRADNALRDSEERSRILFQSITDALVVHGLEPDGIPGRFIEVNDVACQRLGYTREEMLSMSPLDIDVPGSESIARSIGERLLNGDDVIAEQSHITKTGEHIPVEIHAHLFTLRGQLAVIALVRDIRERKSNERALRESEERLAQAVNVARLGIFEHDHATGAFHCSPACREILGWDDTETACPETVLKNVWPEDRELLASNMQKGRDPRGSGISHTEFRVAHADGIRWVEGGAETFFEGEGASRRAGRTVGALQDITERKFAELRLSESQQQLRATLDAVQLGIWSRDLLTGDYDVDEMTRSLFGWSGDEIITETELFSRVVPEDRELMRELREGLEAGEIGWNQPTELRAQLPGGEIRWVCIRGSLLHDSSGKPVRTSGVIRDITDHKRSELEMQKLQEQYLHAQKMEAVGRLAGGIAHDFNNLLMVIRSYAEMLQDCLPSNDRLRNNTQSIMKAADRAASLTGQMLAFSRKQVLSPVVLNLNTAVAESAKMLRRLIGEDIELQVIPGEKVWAVRADPDQIAQVLMNLSINARDAMPKGGKLTIATRNVTADEKLIAKNTAMLPGDYVAFYVADNGTGIAKEIQERMFEPFFTTKTVGKGTGLGLSTVYGIVKQSGGYLSVDSEPGHGACFTVYLPRVEDAVSAADMKNAEILPGGSETLLVVEDEDALRESIGEFLVGLGYEVLSAKSGMQALALASECRQPIDLMITDVVMPKISGRELSQMLGSLRPELKTIFMSGYMDDEIVRNGVQQDAVAFLQKPFSLSTLARRVREILGVLPAVSAN